VKLARVIKESNTSVRSVDAFTGYCLVDVVHSQSMFSLRCYSHCY